MSPIVAASRIRRALRRDGQPEPAEERRSGPVVTFAGILDGRHLWLALDPGPLEGARPALRWADGRVSELACATADDVCAPDGGHLLHCRVPLTDLPTPGTGGGVAHLVVLTVTGAVDPLVPEGLLGGAVRRPSSMPAGLRGDLRRTRDGRLELVLSHVDGLAHLRRTAVEDEALRLVVTTDTEADALVLLRERAVVATVDVDPIPGGLTCLVRPETAAPCAEPLVVAVRAAGLTMPVRRAEDDLDTPDAAVALPATTADGGSVRRLLWRRDGVLTLVASDEPGSGTGEGAA